MADGEIYKGEEFLYLVETITETGTELIRPFDQTGGGTSISADEIELDTKDRSGSDYGKVTQTISLEGNITEGDPFPDYIKKAMRNKEFVKIYEVNTRTKEAEYGMYMLTTFDREYTNGDLSTYTLDGTLYGNVCTTTLTEIPDGAPPLEGMDCDGDTGGGVEG